jgi:hypothetical protein
MQEAEVEMAEEAEAETDTDVDDPIEHRASKGQGAALLPLHDTEPQTTPPPSPALSSPGAAAQPKVVQQAPVLVPATGKQGPLVLTDAQQPQQAALALAEGGGDEEQGALGAQRRAEPGSAEEQPQAMDVQQEAPPQLRPGIGVHEDMEQEVEPPPQLAPAAAAASEVHGVGKAGIALGAAGERWVETPPAEGPEPEEQQSAMLLVAKRGTSTLAPLPAPALLRKPAAPGIPVPAAETPAPAAKAPASKAVLGTDGSGFPRSLLQATSLSIDGARTPGGAAPLALPPASKAAPPSRLGPGGIAAAAAAAATPAAAVTTPMAPPASRIGDKLPRLFPPPGGTSTPAPSLLRPAGNTFPPAAAASPAPPLLPTPGSGSPALGAFGLSPASVLTPGNPLTAECDPDCDHGDPQLRRTYGGDGLLRGLEADAEETRASLAADAALEADASLSACGQVSGATPLRCTCLARGVSGSPPKPGSSGRRRSPAPRASTSATHTHR